MRARTIGLLASAAMLSGVTAMCRPRPKAMTNASSFSEPACLIPATRFALWGTTNSPPEYLLDDLLVPSAPYARGGQHFSNGATWVEHFARARGLASSVRPAFASAMSGASNYAVGAARAREDGRNVNLPAQVDAFLQQHGGVAAPDGSVCDRNGRQ